MKIDLVPGEIPYKSQVSPLNPDQKNNLCDQIDEWLEQGMIEPSVSPWALPLILVKKKDARNGSQNMMEILHSLQGTTVFSSLDACGAYHAVRIEPGSQVWTACIILFYTFQYVQMPFGLANAGSVYSRMLDVAMKEVDRDWAGIKIQPCKT